MKILPFLTWLFDGGKSIESEIQIQWISDETIYIFFCSSDRVSMKIDFVFGTD